MVLLSRPSPDRKLTREGGSEGRNGIIRSSVFPCLSHLVRISSDRIALLNEISGLVQECSQIQLYKKVSDSERDCIL
jgi:hypothetical protein